MSPASDSDDSSSQSMNTRKSGAASTDTVDNVEVDTDDDRVESGDDGNERAGDGGRKLIKISHNNNTAVHQAHLRLRFTWI